MEITEYILRAFHMKQMTADFHTHIPGFIILKIYIMRKGFDFKMSGISFPHTAHIPLNDISHTQHQITLVTCHCKHTRIFY